MRARTSQPESTQCVLEHCQPHGGAGVERARDGRVLVVDGILSGGLFVSFCDRFLEFKQSDKFIKKDLVCCWMAPQP